MNQVLRRTLRYWRASWRDTSLLLGEFRLPLILFLLAILGGGGLYFVIARAVGEAVSSLSEAVYLVLTMVFLQPNSAFPRSPLLQVFYFVMPIVGLGLLAQGLADFGILLFNRRARSREWEVAVASTLENHHVLVGLGHLGFRVVRFLHEMGEPIVVIEREPQTNLVTSVRKMDIPVIIGDASLEEVLRDAHISRARSIILCVQNDALNLKIALKARSIRPDIRVVIRIFDDDFADELHTQFGFHALSATAIAAPAFAASAAGADISHPIHVEGEALSLARLKVLPRSELDGKTVGEVEDRYSVSIVLVRDDRQSQIHPTDRLQLKGGDSVVVLGRPDKLNALVHASQ